MRRPDESDGYLMVGLSVRARVAGRRLSRVRGRRFRISMRFGESSGYRPSIADAISLSTAATRCRMSSRAAPAVCSPP